MAYAVSSLLESPYNLNHNREKTEELMKADKMLDQSKLDTKKVMGPITNAHQEKYEEM